jgi:hypothetical protein
MPAPPLFLQPLVSFLIFPPARAFVFPLFSLHTIIICIPYFWDRFIYLPAGSKHIWLNTKKFDPSELAGQLYASFLSC